MDVLTALYLILAAALSGAACGWLGGKGGTRALTRRVNEHDDDLEAVDRRLRRREGAAGQERRQKVDAEVDRIARAAGLDQEDDDAPAPAPKRPAVAAALRQAAAPITREQIMAAAERQSRGG